MSSPARKLARQQKRNSPEAKEQSKQEELEKKAAQPPQQFLGNSPNANSYKPQMRIRQRRAGNS